MDALQFSSDLAFYAHSTEYYKKQPLLFLRTPCWNKLDKLRLI